MYMVLQLRISEFGLMAQFLGNELRTQTKNKNKKNPKTKPNKQKPQANKKTLHNDVVGQKHIIKVVEIVQIIVGFRGMFSRDLPLKPVDFPNLESFSVFMQWCCFTF